MVPDSQSLPALAEGLTSYCQALITGIPDLLNRINKLEQEAETLRGDVKDQKDGSERWIDDDSHGRFRLTMSWLGKWEDTP